MKIIGIGHRKGMGKDTFAEYLSDAMIVEDIDKVDIWNFATTLKIRAYHAFQTYGLMEPMYYDVEREAKEATLPDLGISPRELFIRYGQFMRSIHEDYWVDKALARGKRLDLDYLIIPDVRYPNEVKRIKDEGGHLIRIVNPRVTITHDEADDALEGFEDWDTNILNDGSLEDLQRKAELLVPQLT